VASPSPMGALVNFWWMEAAADRLGPMDSLMHAMLTLRHAPVAERAGWKAIFDHYIFDHAADDMDHIPEGGRGILGELDDQERARIRQYLADQLRLKS